MELRYPPDPFLSREEYAFIRGVALKLSATHLRLVSSNVEESEKFERTYFGLCAEYATIKFFKYHLGYIGPLVFNTYYPNGFDGGWDFKIEGVKFDVKYDATALGIPSSRICKPTRADIYILVVPSQFTEVRGMNYHVKGFLPASRVPLAPNSFIRSEAFKRIYEITNAFPSSFIGPVPYSKVRGRLELAGEVIPRMFQQWIDSFNERMDVKSEVGDT